LDRDYQRRRLQILQPKYLPNHTHKPEKQRRPTAARGKTTKTRPKAPHHLGAEGRREQRLATRKTKDQSKKINQKNNRKSQEEARYSNPWRVKGNGVLGSCLEKKIRIARVGTEK